MDVVGNELVCREYSSPKGPSIDLEVAFGGGRFEIRPHKDAKINFHLDEANYTESFSSATVNRRGSELEIHGRWLKGPEF